MKTQNEAGSEKPISSERIEGVLRQVDHQLVQVLNFIYCHTTPEDVELEDLYRKIESIEMEIVQSKVK